MTDQRRPKRASLASSLTMLLLSAAFGASSASAGQIGFDFNNDALIGFNCPTSVSGCVLGYTFQVTQNVTVTGLGFWRDPDFGFVTAHAVGLWDSSHAQLATATVSNSTTTSYASASGISAWYVSSITPLVLKPGTYTIAAFFGPTANERAVSAASYRSVQGLVMGLPMQSFSASLVEPTTQINTSRFGYYGATLELADIPEPSTAALALLGAGCAFVIRKRRASLPKA